MDEREYRNESESGNGQRLDSLILQVLKAVTPHRQATLPLDMSVASLGLDSLAFSQLVVGFEELFCELSDDALDRLMIANTLGDVRQILADASSGD